MYRILSISQEAVCVVGVLYGPVWPPQPTLARHALGEPWPCFSGAALGPKALNSCVERMKRRTRSGGIRVRDSSFGKGELWLSCASIDAFCCLTKIPFPHLMRHANEPSITRIQYQKWSYKRIGHLL